MGTWHATVNPVSALGALAPPAVMPPVLPISPTDWLSICEPLSKFPLSGQQVVSARKSLLEANFKRSRNVPAATITGCMLAFERRAASKAHPVGEEEVARTYSILASLLNDAPTADSMPWICRWLASIHFLSHMADPGSISQGSRMAAGPTCIMHRVITLYPSRLARWIYDLAVSRSTDVAGRRIVAEESSVRPGKEELLYRPDSNQRSYAVKLFHLVVFNACLPDNLVYIECNGRPGRKYKGQTIADLQGNEISLAPELPLISLSRFARLNFGDTRTFFAHRQAFDHVRSEYVDQRDLPVVFDNIEDLSEALEVAARERKLPITISVDERRLLADSYRDGVNHLVNVAQFKDFASPHVFNPRLLPGMQRNARVHLQKLFSATFAHGRDAT